ncbi:hypothetical protein [Sphingobacterium sp. SYP-B4668]|uniref:hypothetical protein n=1 Tax=Sphingobacterium sp. SYP-B4668 TaxID=2996035 RepID=UPI0022DDE454|nr:hypothetical protein [Sphingobacterium sp. SYP-B4668]
MKKLLFAFIATFGLCASGMAAEKTPTIPTKKMEAATAKAWTCTMTVKIYRDGFVIGHDIYSTTTNGTCHSFFKAIKKMYSEQGFDLN